MSTQREYTKYCSITSTPTPPLPVSSIFTLVLKLSLAMVSGPFLSKLQQVAFITRRSTLYGLENTNYLAHLVCLLDQINRKYHKIRE